MAGPRETRNAAGQFRDSRSAAAILEARRFKTDKAAMIVQSFSPVHRWFEDFAAFCGLFDLDAAPGRARAHILPSGLALDLGWATGSQDFV